MFWRRKASISDDLAGWIEDSFDWVAGQFGADWFSKRPLVTPTASFFTAKKSDIPGLAKEIASALDHNAPFHILPIQTMAAEYRYDPTALSSVAGQYHHDNDTPLITYDPELQAQPLAFINTIAHEIMHARLAPYIHDMPGGEAVHELTTDLHCITHGMGIFALEGPAQAGWSGYMTLESRAWALARFLELTGKKMLKTRAAG